MHRLVDMEKLKLWLNYAEYKDVTLSEFADSIISIMMLTDDPFIDIVLCRDCNHYDSEMQYCKLWQTYHHERFDFCSKGTDKDLLSS